MIPGVAAAAGPALDAVGGMGQDSSSLNFQDETNFGGNINQSAGGGLWLAAAAVAVAVVVLAMRKK